MKYLKKIIERVKKFSNYLFLNEHERQFLFKCYYDSILTTQIL